jgi:hypothetical protein
VLQVCPECAYAGAGNMVKRDSTVLIGNYYEYTNGSAKKFYYAGGVRIALRPADGVARWILSDHLGSTAKTVSAGGATEGEQRYMPLRLRSGQALRLVFVKRKGDRLTVEKGTTRRQPLLRSSPIPDAFVP